MDRRTVAALLLLLCLPACRADVEPAPHTLARMENGFPHKSLTIMAPANPGGGWDQTARAVQHALTAERILPVTAEVINRGGAGGTIGLAELVGRDDPHTVMVTGRVMLGSILTNQSAVSLSQTAPLARLLDEYEVIAVPQGSRYSTFEALLADFRQAPERISWGGGSAGGTDHILIAMIAQAAGVDPRKINYVAYSGGGEAAVSVIGGHVTAGVSGYSEWKPHAESGSVRLLAISSADRLGPDSPPTIRESGLDVVMSNWRAAVASPGTDAQTRAWLAEALARMRESATWQQTIRANGWVDSFLTGPELEAFIASETASNTSVLASIGLVTPEQGTAEYAAVGPWFMPAIIVLGLLLSGLFLLLSNPGAAIQDVPQVDRRGAVSAAALILAYILVLNTFGYILATTLFLFGLARLLGSRRWLRDGIFGIVTSLVIYVLFNTIFKIGLPSGLLG